MPIQDNEPTWKQLKSVNPGKPLVLVGIYAAVVAVIPAVFIMMWGKQGIPLSYYVPFFGPALALAVCSGPERSGEELELAGRELKREYAILTACSTIVLWLVAPLSGFFLLFAVPFYLGCFVLTLFTALAANAVWNQALTVWAWLWSGVGIFFLVYVVETIIGKLLGIV